MVNSSAQNITASSVNRILTKLPKMDNYSAHKTPAIRNEKGQEKTVWKLKKGTVNRIES